ncbi:hypothetical protein [Kitasatospora sp. NBC_01539]|uniref:hypothetical protein n=1 Tax=Kitasatospora sp. NBC_01539 TaxID=2903577 RepID=UPI003860261A
MSTRSRPTAPHLFRWRVEIPHCTAQGQPEESVPGRDGTRPGVHLFIVDAAEPGHALAEALARAESEEARRHRRHAPLAIEPDLVSVVKLCHVA